MMNFPEKGDGIIVQGITGTFGRQHTRQMLDYGTKVVAGVTPRRGGEQVEGVPVYNTMKEAMAATGARASIIFVPAPAFYQAAEEAILAGIKLLVGITEHVPIRDTIKMLGLSQKYGVTIIGPNCPGIIIPSRTVKMGIMPNQLFKEGRVALFSKSGTLMYEVASQLTNSGLGESIALGIGGDPVTCMTMPELFDWVRDRTDTDAVVMVGEIGGDAEEKLAQWLIDTKFSKPIVSYVAGRSAPKEKKMGHAGAIIYGNYGTAASKNAAMKAAGAEVAMVPADIPGLVRKALSSR